MKKRKRYNLGNELIKLKEACITEFWQVDDETVEVEIEDRDYNTLYRMKKIHPPSDWHYGNRSCFIQLLRSKMV